MPIEKFPQRPKLEGRKVTVKAEPLKGKRPRHNQIAGGNQANSTGESRVEGSSGTERRKYRRRRRRRVDNSSQTAPQTKVYSPETSTTRRRSRRQSVPTAPAPALSAPPAASAPTSAPPAAPLAPPAARKGE